jgi:uncharacterized repeat protein (TIGR03803 family)
MQKIQKTMKKLYTIIVFVFIGTFANAQYTKLLDFAGTANGSAPTGSLISDGNFLYGMTTTGGTGTCAHGCGVIFKLKSDGTGDTTLLNFSGVSNGSYPQGSLISDGTFMYGMTFRGGMNDYGVVFKIKPDGTGYVKLFDFNGTINGYNPLGSLISDGIFLYGMTCRGGANNYGTIFKIKPDGTGYAKLLDFNGTANGSHPYGSLISDGTFLYGMTYDGGANNVGVIFKIKPDGTNFSKLLDFVFTAYGDGPAGDLFYDGTFLYGMTTAGGINNYYGTIFKIKPDGTGCTKLLDFAGVANGESPFGSLISDGTYLYGTTLHGGTNAYGTLFKIQPDGTGYSKLLDFAGAANGRNPWANLLSDGTFMYGMTYAGGINDSGTIFKINPIGMGIAENNTVIDFTIYPNPFSTQTTLQTDEIFKDATLTVYNLFGQTVKQIDNLSGQTIIFHRDNLPSGLYFIRIAQDNKTFSVDKLVITDN